MFKVLPKRTWKVRRYGPAVLGDEGLKSTTKMKLNLFSLDKRMACGYGGA